MITKSILTRSKQFDILKIIVNPDAHILVTRFKSIHGNSYIVNGVEYGSKKRGVLTENTGKIKQYIRTLIKRYSGIH